MDPVRESSEGEGAVAVTGGGNGIGRATALSCAGTGRAVAVLDLDGAAAQAVARQALNEGAPTAIGLQCDVRDEHSISQAMANVDRNLGPLTGLVTSAGIDRGGLAHELPLERWHSVIDTNLTGTFLACKHALLRMIGHEMGGSIVCVSSPWGFVSALGGVSAYSSSKAGVSSLVRSLSLDYAQHNIRVNAVVPGPTETDLMWAGVPEGQVPELRSRIESQLAFGRLADPFEIAAGIIWLLSKRASYVTGTQLVIDGGLLARASIEA